MISFTVFGQDQESQLPPIAEMLKVVKAYIWRTKGAMINIYVDMNNENRELMLLERAYNIAIQNFQPY